MRKLAVNPDAVAAKIKLPLHRWPGRCHEIAILIVQAKLVRGRAVYGHYHGEIHPDSIFGGRPFTHHGWITRRTTIVDPTRWVFECADPYIYVGPKDDPDYDPGGNRVRKMFLKPPPAFNPKQNCFRVPQGLLAFTAMMLGDHRKELSAEQVMWLANLPLDMLSDMAEPVFLWIADDIKIPGFIPYDNRMTIIGR